MLCSYVLAQTTAGYEPFSNLHKPHQTKFNLNFGLMCVCGFSRFQRDAAGARFCATPIPVSPSAKVEPTADYQLQPRALFRQRQGGRT